MMKNSIVGVLLVFADLKATRRKNKMQRLNFTCGT
jgi:hypothetical protein